MSKRLVIVLLGLGLVLGGCSNVNETKEQFLKELNLERFGESAELTNEEKKFEYFKCVETLLSKNYAQNDARSNCVSLLD